MGFDEIREKITQTAAATRDQVNRFGDVPRSHDAFLIDGRWVKAAPRAQTQLQTLSTDTECLFRVVGDVLAAVVPNPGPRLSNGEVFDALMKALHPREMRSEAFVLRPFDMHLRLVLPQSRQRINMREGQHEDVGFAGIHLAYSELGARPFTCGGLLWRQVCTNGAYMIETARTIQADLTTVLRTDEALVRTLRNCVRDALADANVAAVHMREESLVPDPDLGMYFRLLELGMAEEYLEEALAHLEAVDALTRFDLVNGLTAAARRLEDPDERLEMESWGARLLTMPRTRLPGEGADPDAARFEVETQQMRRSVSGSR